MKNNLEYKGMLRICLLFICFLVPPPYFAHFPHGHCFKTFSNLTIQQQYQISGTVTDNYGPMPGVHVLIKGTKTGTFTNPQGEYFLLVNNNDILVFSYLGYHSRELPVLGRTTMDVEMRSEVTELKEVEVNAGYYTVKEKERTGSISRVAAKEIALQPVANPMAALQGRMTGVSITQTSGVPGAGFNIQIRGRNSIAAGNNPLYVIDGVPVSSEKIASNSNLFRVEVGIDPLNNINPNNIQSIEILKDADATAIYGSRGANGVVLITTKKGGAGKTKIDVNIRSGIGEVSNTRKMLNTRQYLEMRHEAFANDGVEPTEGTAPDLLLWDQNRYTDWQEKLFGGTATITESEAYVSGGNQQTSFRIGGGVRKETTVFPGDFDYSKIMGNLHITHNSENKKLRAEVSINYGKDKNMLFNSTTVQQALQLPPNAPALYNDDGELNWEITEDGVVTFENPLGPILNEQSIHSNNLIVNSILSYEIIKDLDIKVSAGYTDFKQKETILTPIESSSPAIREYMVSIHSRMNQERESWIIEPQINFNKTLKGSSLEFLLGTTWQRIARETIGITAYGYDSSLLLNNLSAASESLITRYNPVEYKYNAVYGRLGYNINKRYYINLTGRRDGSTRFGPGKQFANFGAIGTAWIFSEEPWVKSHIPYLSFGKIRGSYGTTGNDQIGDYGFLSTYSPITQPFNFRGNGGLYPTRLANPDYGWEINKKMELALETGFLRDYVLFSLNWYRNRSSNQLVGYRLPYITGFNTMQANLPATVQNTGWEIQLSSTHLQNQNFTWSTKANLTIPKNKLLDFPNIEATAYGNAFEIGKPLNIQKLYQYQEIDPNTGLYTVLDANGDGLYNHEDQIAIIDMGRKYFGGLQNTISHKRLQLDFLLEFVKQKGTGLLGDLIPGYLGNQPEDVMDRWRSIGDETNIQMFTQSNYTPYYLARSSSLNITDASFIRLKNVSLSYSFGADILEKLNLSHFGISLQAQNLLTWTNYFGLDPQSPDSLYNLPALRTITASIQLQF